MTIHIRPYAGAADLQHILDLKRACTTPENMYDTPTISELRMLLAPLPRDPAMERPPWEDAQGAVIRHLHWRARTQQATMLWVEADGQLLAWAIAGMQEQARQCGRTFSLWCRCHDHETERRALLEGAGFKPLPARDLRLVRPLDIPLPAAHLPAGFV